MKHFKHKHWAATVHRYKTSDGAAVMVQLLGASGLLPLRLAKHKLSRKGELAADFPLGNSM